MLRKAAMPMIQPMPSTQCSAMADTGAARRKASRLPASPATTGSVHTSSQAPYAIGMAISSRQSMKRTLITMPTCPAYAVNPKPHAT